MKRAFMALQALRRLDVRRAEKIITEFVKEQVADRGVILGLSGGVDSSTVAALLVRALGNERVLALIMPDATSTLQVDIEDAMKIVETYNLRFKRIEIAGLVGSFLGVVGKVGDKVAEGNLKARLRMAILYYFANVEKRIVIGSGDRSELMIGYFTKYGDGGVDILPIGGLYKTQVRLLAKYIGIPNEISEKESSPRLWPGHTIEEELGMTYEEIDEILYYYLDLRYDLQTIVGLLGEDKRQKVENVLRRIKANEHKLRPPPTARLPPEILFGRSGMRRAL
ncbi:MAG: NAD+ synthase [Candidatus Methanomethylicaceae archaeon]